MSTRARPVDMSLAATDEENNVPSLSEVAFIAVPVAVMKKLSEVGSSRGLSAAQVLGTAVDQYLKNSKTESNQKSGPRLLTEDE